MQDSFSNIRNRQQPLQQHYDGYTSYEPPTVTSVDPSQFNSYLAPKHQEIPSPTESAAITSSKQFEAFKVPRGKFRIPRWLVIVLGITVFLIIVFVLYSLISSKSSVVDPVEEERLHRAFNEKIVREREEAQREYEERQNKLKSTTQQHQNQPPVRNLQRSQAVPQQRPIPPAVQANQPNVRSSSDANMPDDGKTAYVSSHDESDDDLEGSTEAPAAEEPVQVPKTEELVPTIEEPIRTAEERKEEAEPEVDDGTGQHDVDYDKYGYLMEERDRQEMMAQGLKEQEEYELQLERERMSNDARYQKQLEKDKVNKPPKKRSILRGSGKIKKNTKPVLTGYGKKPNAKDKTQPKKDKLNKKEVSQQPSSKPVAKSRSAVTDVPKQKKTQVPKPERKSRPKSNEENYNNNKKPKRSNKYDVHEVDDEDYEDFGREIDTLLNKHDKKVKPSRMYKKRSVLKKGKGKTNPYLYNYDDEDEPKEEVQHHWDGYGMDDHDTDEEETQRMSKRNGRA